VNDFFSHVFSNLWSDPYPIYLVNALKEHNEALEQIKFIGSKRRLRHLGPEIDSLNHEYKQALNVQQKSAGECH
jgi:hypothetical protein